MPGGDPDYNPTQPETDTLARALARMSAGQQLTPEELRVVQVRLDVQRARLRQEARRLRHPEAEASPVRPPRFDRENTLTVQLALTEDWGSDEEFARRQRLVEAVNRLLEPGGYAEFSGSEIGGGKTNLFWSRIWDADWAWVVERVLAELDRAGWLDRAVLVRSYFTSSADPPDVEFPDVEVEVVWPEGFQGPFSLL